VEEKVMARPVSRRVFLRTVGSLAAVAAAGGVGAKASAPRGAARAEDFSPEAIRFGVQTPPQHTTYGAILEVWQEVETLGFDTAFVFDHFIPIRSDPFGPCLEGWTLLSALASQTQRLRLGVLVTGNTYRHPAVLAKMAATVDHVSGGRLILGMGAGWFELEHRVYGIPFHTVGGRARRLVEAVEVVKTLFTHKESNYEGKYYQLKNAPFEPKGVQQPHPPILIGGMGPKVIQPLAARHADIWHFFVARGDPVRARQIVEAFDEICRQVGRDPATVEKSTSLRPADIGGQPAEVGRKVAALAQAGVRHFIVSLFPSYDMKALRRFAKEVMPAVRAGEVRV
jgi:F420-dependent oxidoreductase-like protein